MPDDSTAIRLMLILPAGFAPEAASALARAGDVAAVIARCGEAPEERARLTRLAGLLQQEGCAVVAEGRADLAKPLGLDGAHLDGIGGLKAGLPALRPGLIAGVGGLTTRHDAMEAGEAGADYVLFGGTGAPFEETLDGVSWWAELFEVPCVGVAGTLMEVVALAGSGADFIALTGDLLTPEGVAEAQARAAGAGA
ncbi:thiamine phosphate synthase [Aquabacter cavernae]|uniref:thiamine phosphate synthase n=1 Tax=Aquabacter cavernae TaxID=2496029 RepID=UPI000F8CC626|nr:thiamine phosphate synthase [Aquabacter cavernae]